MGARPNLARREAVELVRGVRELREGEGEEGRSGSEPPRREVNPSRGDLDQPLEVPLPVPDRADPDRLPVLVRLEESARREGGEPPVEAVAVAGQGSAQAFGRAERISSISSTST